MRYFKPEDKTKIYFYLLLLLAFTIPLYRTFSSSAILLLGLFWLIESSPRAKFKRLMNPKETRYLIGFSLLYVVYFIGVLYSEGTFSNKDSLFVLQVKASLLIFPLLFATIDFSGFKADHVRKILILFIAGCLVSSMIILGHAIYQFYTGDQSPGVFFYTQLAMNHHPSYLSLIFSFATAVLLTWYLTAPDLSVSRRWTLILLVFFFQFIIVLLSSKAGIIGLVFMYAGVGLFAAFRIKSRLKEAIVIPAILSVVFIILLILNPSVRVRFQAAENVMKPGYELRTDTLDSSVARILIWKSAFDILSENPVFGVGTGDVRGALVEKYQEKKITPAIENEYNAHNQYLQIYLGMGLPGLLVFLMCLGVACFVAFKYANPLYFLFVMLFSFHILVESMLERQTGVVFYAFFNIFLFYFTPLLNGKSDLQPSEV